MWKGANLRMSPDSLEGYSGDNDLEGIIWNTKITWQFEAFLHAEYISTSAEGKFWERRYCFLLFKNRNIQPEIFETANDS